MSTYPDSPRTAFLQWCQTHAPVFVANAAEIGLTPAQATTFNNHTNDAATSLTTQDAAKEAAKVATQETGEAFDTLRSDAGDMVRTIRAFAENSSKPSTVYNLAQIPPPAAPTPAAPPAEPSNLTVTLMPGVGSLMLKWKAVNPTGTSGTSYIIRRRLPTESAFSFIGISGKKEFLDDTLLAGPDSVQYTVQGQRADSSGPVSPIFVVNFGQLPSRAMSATVTRGGNGAVSLNAGHPMSDQALVNAIVNSAAGGNGSLRPSRV